MSNSACCTVSSTCACRCGGRTKAGFEASGETCLSGGITRPFEPFLGIFRDLIFSYTHVYGLTLGDWGQGHKVGLSSFQQLGLHNKMGVVVSLCYGRKMKQKLFSWCSTEHEGRSLTAWANELLCSLVVKHDTSVSAEDRRTQSFSIPEALHRHLISPNARQMDTNDVLRPFFIDPCTALLSRAVHVSLSL